MYEIVIGRNEAERAKLGLKGTVLLGKHYVRMGETESLSNHVYMDVNHSHVVFICGKRGSGKCILGDTLIPLSDGSLKRIKELEADTDVFGLNNQLKIEKLPKKEFYQRKVNKILKVTLRSGKQIELTPEHPLLTVRGWVKAENLTINDRIATPRVIPVFGDKALRDDEVKMLAYLIAEGHITNKMIRFTNFDSNIVTDFKAAVAAFDSCKVVEYKNGQFGITNKQQQRITTITARNAKGQVTNTAQVFTKNSLNVFLSSIGFERKTSFYKRIPECIFTLPKSQLALFLNRLFSCDGTIYKSNNTWAISYAAKSEQLLKQVQHLLLRFGIKSRVRPKVIKLNNNLFPNFQLEVYDVDEYINEIGFFGEKNDRALLASVQRSEKKKNPNLDTIPRELWDHYRPQSWTSVGKSMNYSHPKALRESLRYSPSRQKLLQIAQADSREDIELIAKSDIYWDFIESIEQKTGSFEVYDITVPNHHNFVANDIIVHNSYTMGSIAEGMAILSPELRKHMSVVILDTMGIFWTMKYPNKKDKTLLADWGLSGDGLDVVIYTPKGYYQDYIDKGIPTDFSFSVLASELSAGDWCMAFEISPNEPLGATIEKVIGTLKENNEKYSIDDILRELHKQKDSQVQAAINRFENAKGWGLFSDDGTPLGELVKPGQISILDVSCYAGQGGSWNIRSLVIGLVAQKLFQQRMSARKDEEYSAVQKDVLFTRPAELEHQPLVWLLIDEAHEFLPREGKTPASDSLITILREGRQPGISLVLATQQPGKIHTDVMTQSDIIISHRITAKLDTDALSALTQSYMRGDLDKFLNELPRVKGAAVVLDDNNEKLFPIRVRPRQTWHGGSDPELLSKE